MTDRNLANTRRNVFQRQKQNLNNSNCHEAACVAEFDATVAFILVMVLIMRYSRAPGEQRLAF